jgi:hypothetical protein
MELLAEWRILMEPNQGNHHRQPIWLDAKISLGIVNPQLFPYNMGTTRIRKEADGAGHE